MKKLVVRITVTEELTDGALFDGKQRIAFASVYSRANRMLSTADFLRELADQVESKARS